MRSDSAWPRFLHILRLAAVLTALSLCRLFSVCMAQESPPRTVCVLLWFDTEDYLLPADDDATKRLCELLTARGIRATFKLVGEKARTLERRGRRDVIAALQHHAIGYHSDYHSVHPAPAEYLADCGWLDGVAEFVRRESAGAADVRRIFGVPTLACYGQPGSSWAPQAVAALSQLRVAPHGVPCYVDEDAHIGLDGKPFWYCGTLNVFRMRPNLARMELHDPAALEPAKRQISGIADRLRAGGGGLISIFYHPCEWVHREFWDSVNFARGANPPREEWKPPRQRPAEETEAAFNRFAQYIDYIKSLPNVRWIAADDLPGLYPDRLHSEGASEAELDEIAERIYRGGWQGLDDQLLGNKAFSPAEQFELLATGLNEVCAARPVSFPLHCRGLLGPDAPPPVCSVTNIDGLAFRDALQPVARFVQIEGRVPARVFIGAEQVAPADFLLGMAAAWKIHRQHPAQFLRQTIPLGHDVPIIPERFVAKDTPALYGNWIVHKAGFRAPRLVELARLQAWTLKPALPRTTP